MNILSQIKEGIKGNNRGLSFALPFLNRELGGIHPFYYVIAGGEKTGKTSFLDMNFIAGPYLANETNVEYHYWSMEISRTEKEAKMISFFLNHYHGIEISAEVILGRSRNENGETVKLTKQQYAKIKDIYYSHIIPLFGEFDNYDRCIQPGRIKMYTRQQTASAIERRLYAIAKANGELITEEQEVIKDGVSVRQPVVIGYKPNDEERRVIVILDHMRKLKRSGERKDSIDTISTTFCQVRDLFKFTTVGVIHLNRNYTSDERKKTNSEFMYPNTSDTKDSGNVGEDANTLIALFDPSTVGSGIKVHFGHNLEDYGNTYRSAHIVTSRNSPVPYHQALRFHGACGFFEEIPPTTINFFNSY